MSYFVPHNHWFAPLGCHLFTKFLGNVGILGRTLIPPCTNALLGLPAHKALFRWLWMMVIQTMT